MTTVRIHTRFPIAIPERVDAGLLRAAARHALNTVVVVHAQPRERARCRASQRALRGAAGRALTALLNQSVLLRGVNDDVDVLATLSERLFACGVLPYYLHLLDPRRRGGALRRRRATAARLIAALRARLPGYLVPRLVRETPGELSKTVIA